jgi:cytochrome b
MNTTSASPADLPHAAGAAAPDAVATVPVWDVPVRLVHWLMVACVAGAWLTAERESWRLLHVTLGYTLGGLVAFRAVWGLVGSRTARFASFVRGPAAVVRYLRSLLHGTPEHHAGHNPAGALAILALLAVSAVLVASGHALYAELGGEWLEDAHELAANGLIALVAVHVAGVVVSSVLHRENLVRAMVTGRRCGEPSQAIRRRFGVVGAAVLTAVLGFWVLQWRDAPPAGAQPVAADAGAGDHDHDDD